jgi:hypothetical protein
LLNFRTGLTRTVGSNPTVSAILQRQFSNNKHP